MPPRPPSQRAAQRKIALAKRNSRPWSQRGASSRWAALHNVFEDSSPTHSTLVDCDVPVLALVSLAGGVGKTSLVASMGRSLAVLGESSLLVDTSMHVLLPLYFGSHDLSSGGLSTFAGSGEAAAVHVMTTDPEPPRTEPGEELHLAEKIAAQAQEVDRILIDVATGSSAITRELLRLTPTVLMTLTPDMASVVSLPSARAFFQQQAEAIGRPFELYYILNQFDASLRLHNDVHDLLARQLGERLLPFAIRRSSAVSEALAEGMTVVDYVPGSPIVEDLDQLSLWIRELDLPAKNEIHPILRREQSC
jgi:cellulose synthase operon protein YhjQ